MARVVRRPVLRLVELCCEARKGVSFVLHNGDARRPRLFHSHERQCATGQCEVLGEGDQVGLSLIRIIRTPEIVHQRRRAQEKTNEGCRAPAWLHAEQNARSTEKHSYSGSNHRGRRHRQVLRSRVLRERLSILEVINGVVNEEAAEDNSADSETVLSSPFPLWRSIRRHSGLLYLFVICGRRSCVQLSSAAIIFAPKGGACRA